MPFYFPRSTGWRTGFSSPPARPLRTHAGWLLVLKGVLSAALLLGPTILMGGTLPLLAAWLHQFSADAGRRSARFYSVNSLGAVAGAALAGFWLVQEYGMVATIQITATANVVIGASAILLNRSGWLPKPVAATETTTVATAPEIARRTGHVALGGNDGGDDRRRFDGAGTAGVAVAGADFRLVAAILRDGADRLHPGHRSGQRVDCVAEAGPAKRRERTVVLLLCVAAAWVTLLVFNIERWVDFYRIARTGLGRTAGGLCLSTAADDGHRAGDSGRAGGAASARCCR